MSRISENIIAAELRRRDIPAGVAREAAVELAAKGYQSTIVRNAYRVNGSSRHEVDKALRNAGWVVQADC